MPDKVLIFDTTLRDGEQSPGASMNQEEKLSIASEIKDCQIAGLARAKQEDIETAWYAVKKLKIQGSTLL